GGGGLAVGGGDEPEEHPSRDFLLVHAERPEGGLGVTADRAAHPSSPDVGGERQRVVLTFAPQIEQRRREQRQSAGLTGNLVDQRIGQRRPDLAAGSLRVPPDRSSPAHW